MESDFEREGPKDLSSSSSNNSSLSAAVWYSDDASGPVSGGGCDGGSGEDWDELEKKAAKCKWKQIPSLYPLSFSKLQTTHDGQTHFGGRRPASRSLGGFACQRASLLISTRNLVSSSHILRQIYPQPPHSRSSVNTPFQRRFYWLR